MDLDKVFRENGKELYGPDFYQYLRKVLYSDIIFLLLELHNSKEPYIV